MYKVLDKRIASHELGTILVYGWHFCVAMYKVLVQASHYNKLITP